MQIEANGGIMLYQGDVAEAARMLELTLAVVTATAVILVVRWRVVAGTARGGRGARVRRVVSGAAIRRLGARHISLVGLLLTIGPPAGAKPKAPSPPRRGAELAPAPWSRSSGSPPPPLDPIKGRPHGLHDLLREGSEPRRDPPKTAGQERKVRTHVAPPEATSTRPARTHEHTPLHPAIHARRHTPVAGNRLFPRAGESRSTPGRSTTTETHTSTARKEQCSHTVVPGESLWSISEDALATEDPAAVAAFWPKLYEANRDTIGSDPDLIYPGQLLTIPGRCDQ